MHYAVARLMGSAMYILWTSDDIITFVRSFFKTFDDYCCKEKIRSNRYVCGILLTIFITTAFINRHHELVSDIVEKNVDSSSKSNPLRRRRKKRKSTNFQQKFVWFTYSN